MRYFKKESDAWRYIAEVFATAPREEQLQGLCFRCDGLRWDRRISMSTHESMVHRIDEYMPSPYEYAYGFTFGTYGHSPVIDHDARCLAALWMGEEAEHEGN